MIEKAARGFRGGVAGRGARRDVEERPRRRLVRRDQPQRFVAGVEDLDRAHDDAAERIPADGTEASGPRRLSRERREPLSVERVARERPAQVGAALAEPRL